MTIPRPALLALLLAAVPLNAARPVDVPLPPPPSGATLQPLVGTYKVAFLGGFLAQEGVASMSLQFDVARVATPPAWRRAQLEWHLPIRVARPSWEGALTRTVVVPGGGIYAELVGTTTDAAWIIEAIPSARLILPVAPGFALHVEAGVGLSQTVETHVEDQIYVGRTETRTLVLAPIVLASIGLTYRLGERLELVMQPAAFGYRIGTDYSSSFSALWGVSYRL